MTRLPLLARVAIVLAALLLGAGMLGAAPTQADDPADTADTAGTAPVVATSARVQTSAVKCFPPRCFVAGSVNLRTGFAYLRINSPTKAKARTDAVQLCKNRTRPNTKDRFCKSAGSAQRNGCLAIVYKVKNDAFVGWRQGGAPFRNGVRTTRTKLVAINNAKRKLGDGGRNRVWVASCTARR